MDRDRRATHVAIDLIGFALVMAVAICRCHAAAGTLSSRDAYVDLALDPNTAASILPGFKKRSLTVVVYMCYNRTSMIEPALESVLRSENLENFDFLISQDGGHGLAPLQPRVPNKTNFAYIRHQENLNAGLHHFFIKQLAFKVLGYESLIIVEEDNIIHPQAIQMLKHMLDMSVDDLEVGLVSIVDTDNSYFVDLKRYGSHITRVGISEGHLWVYGMHATRFRAVHDHLQEYVNIIRREDYQNLHKDPLAARITAMYARKGIPLNIPLSQDANLQFILRLEGFDRRLTTLARLFKPIGHWGLHFRDEKDIFFGRFGTEMFEGRVNMPPKELTREEEADLAATCGAQLARLFMEHLGRLPDAKASSFAVSRMLGGKMNGIVLISCVTKTAKRRTPECRDTYWVR